MKYEVAIECHIVKSAFIMVGSDYFEQNFARPR